MILIDATFVNSKGGINVFRRILESIHPSERYKFVLFVDKRLSGNYSFFHDFKFYNTNGFFNRLFQYQQIKNQVKIIFSLGNVPLLFAKGSYQITYNMQLLLFDRKKVSFINKIKWSFKSMIVRLLFLYTDSDVAVQTNKIKNLISRKYSISRSKIFEFPVFYETRKTTVPVKLSSFFCPSSGEKYKNIEFIIDVFAEYTRVHKNSKLYLTISNKYKKIIDKIKYFNLENIVNLGEISHDEVMNLIKDNYIIIHPSSVESFGLVLLESAYSENIIIAPNLDYVNDVCKPSILYEENNKLDLLNKLNNLKLENLNRSKPKIQNQSDELIKYLISKLD